MLQKVAAIISIIQQLLATRSANYEDVFHIFMRFLTIALTNHHTVKSNITYLLITEHHKLIIER